MLAIFKPVNNNPWYDLRELHIVDWKMRVKRWMSISEHSHLLSELPVFKPLIKCENEQEYQDQFKQYII